MSRHVSIREGRESDADILCSFNMAMAEETEGRSLNERAVLAGVRSVLDDPHRGFYLVAESEGTIVGSLMVTTEWSDWRNGFYWWIQSVYVRPEWRRLGIYRSLHESVRSKAMAAANVCSLRLYVEEIIRRAQEVYCRLGLSETSYRIFEEMLSDGSPC